MARNQDFKDKEQSDLIEKLVTVNRVAKVVKGGRRFSFSALVVVGDGKGRVGVGTGKAREVADAVRKATDKAKRKMIHIPMKELRTLHHDVEGRFGAGRVILRAAAPGTGIIAGGAARILLEVSGLQDVVSKSTGSSNPHNMVGAVLDAFNKLQSPKHVASRRNKPVAYVLRKKASSKADTSATAA